MMCGSDMQNKLGVVSFPAIKKAVRYASGISGISEAGRGDHGATERT